MKNQIVLIVKLLAITSFVQTSLADSLLVSRPNIIFLLTDDQGMGDLSCMGNTVVKTQLAWTTQHDTLYGKDSGESWKLYDLLTDPEEGKNLASAHPEKVEELSKQLAVWRASCKRSDESGGY